jgi:NADH:ubiquinone oxidoreductase subunit E
LEKVYCVGCCSLAPAMIVDQTAHGKLAPGTTKKILKRYT